MFKLPLSSNNLKISQLKFSVSGLSQLDVFSSCGLSTYQRERGEEKRNSGHSRGPWMLCRGCLRGPIRGSLAASKCVSISSASPSPASAFPASASRHTIVLEAAPSTGSTAQGGRRPRRLTHPPWGAPLASWAGAASLVLPCREET